MRGFASFASDLRDHGQQYHALAERVDAIMDRGVERSARAAFGESQRRVPVDTGHLKASGDVFRRSSADWEIRYTADYAAAVERGHRAYTVRPVSADALRFEVDGVTVFARKADIPPTQGVWYLKRSVEHHREDLTRDIGHEFETAVRELFG